MHILGEHGVVRFGPRSNPTRDRYWAERGLIHCESDDGKFESISVHDFLRRLSAISDMLGNSVSELATEGFAHYDELQRQMRFKEAAEALVEKAREQGLPPTFRGKLRVTRFAANICPRSERYAF